nr:uncharacterized protein LOC113804725 [Penaeus vannamei]
MGNTRWLLLLLGLAFMVTSTQAGVLSWFAEDASPGEELQADEPDSDEESDAGDSQVKRLVEAMHGSFVELATKRNTWYDRYDVLAQQAANNSRVITELLGISSVGFRLMWDHDGAFDWDQDDIFFSLHLRRFHPDNDREVVMNDKYDGRWTSDATFVSSEYWPDIKPGQKFEVIVTKKGSCFVVLIWPGEDIYVQLPKPMGYTYRFCPKSAAKPR